jgi:DNA-binding response OmpR family regulator
LRDFATIAGGNSGTAAAVTAPLHAQRILVVEDEYFIAADMRDLLIRAGAEVVGPVGNVSAATWMVDTKNLDAAVLDVNLDGVMSFPVADRLRQVGVPFAFVTGYDEWAMPEEYRDAPRIGKPFSSAGVIACLQGLCGVTA